MNSCIQLLGMIDGKEVVTVEDLHAARAALHPVQAAMVATHGSQCGFCTPGFVMSLFALYHADGAPDRAEVNDCDRRQSLPLHRLPADRRGGD